VWVERDATILRVLCVASRNSDLVLLPVHATILNAKHLALTAAGLECTDDAVVHLGADELVLGTIHLRARRQKRLLFLQSDSTIAFRFLLCLDVHAEPVERRRGEVRRILESTPVDRRTQCAEGTVQRCDLAAFAVRSFEPKNLRRLLECRDWQISERRLDRLESAHDRHRITQSLGLDIVGVIQVQEFRDGQTNGSSLRRRRHPWVSPGRDLAQELRLPDAFGRLLRLDWLAGSARKGEPIDRHAPALALVHDVEPPGMLAAWTGSTAFQRADFSNSHSSPPFVYDSLVGAPRLIQSSTSTG